MRDDREAKDDAEAKASKKVYEPPTLTEYGKVVELTRGGGLDLLGELVNSTL